MSLLRLFLKDYKSETECAKYLTKHIVDFRVDRLPSSKGNNTSKFYIRNYSFKAN